MHTVTSTSRELHHHCHTCEGGEVVRALVRSYFVISDLHMVINSPQNSLQGLAHDLSVVLYRFEEITHLTRHLHFYIQISNQRDPEPPKVIAQEICLGSSGNTFIREQFPSDGRGYSRSCM